MTGGKIAYLTIDDSPSPFMTEKVDYLKEKNIPAIFFVRGDLLKKNEHLVVDAIKKGFIIGNHAFAHRPFSELELEEGKEEIRQTDEMVDHAYKEAGVERPAKLFRFPYGDKGDEHDTRIPLPLKKQHRYNFQVFLRELGYRQPGFENISHSWFVEDRLLEDADIYFTFDVLEWCLLARHKGRMGINTPEDLWKRMDENAPEQALGLNELSSNDIILTHDHDETHYLFKDIIDHLLAKNLDFRLPKLKA